MVVSSLIAEYFKCDFYRTHWMGWRSCSPKLFIALDLLMLGIIIFAWLHAICRLLMSTAPCC